LSSEAQNAYFLRMVPFVVRNYNMVELGPRGTGKSHLFQQVSPYAYLLSGGQTTVAQLFVNNATGQRGLVTQHDVIAFDEIAGIRFKDRDGINVMKGYMASGEFARGRESIRAEGGMAFLGNFEVDVAHQLQRGHLLSPMPEVMRNDTAFMDRLHAYVPGWEIPAVGRDQKTHHYGLVSDLLAQWWHELRSENRYVRVRERIRHNDSWRGRDNEAVEKTVDGLLKLLYPDAEATVLPDDLVWAMELATVSRRRVKEAQASIGEEEFGAVNLGYSVDGSPVATPECPERGWTGAGIDSEFPSLGPVAPPEDHGLPDLLPDPLPPGFPLPGFGAVVDQPSGAQGAFGTIYRVKREFDGRILAGKLFRKDPQAQFADIADQALREEVKSLEALTHQNIVRVLGPIKVTARGEWMVISEWIEGTPLATFTYGDRVMPGPLLHHAGAQLLEAIRYLESENVVHRDIKPANVMIDVNAVVKLIDFNLAREAGYATAMAGTIAYLPPDLMQMGGVTDHFVDRYGVGVTLYELVVGAHPYWEYMQRRQRLTPQSNPEDPRTLRSEVTPALADFLLRAVAPTEDRRFRSATQMARAWSGLKADLESLA
jgi:tRNA A-37 threonylcarbamoyl transferase component Bud32